MEISNVLLLILFNLLTFLMTSNTESNVRNLSCDCSGKNSSENQNNNNNNNNNCPKSAWSILGQNWFDLCWYDDNDICVIKAAVILPNNTSYVASLQKVLPALSLAVDEAKKRKILPPGIKFSFAAYDDQCNAVYGQMNAIEAYANDKPHVIFGPSCEYSVEERDEIDTVLPTFDPPICLLHRCWYHRNLE
ncbi:hypothetical protein Phum_PHUM360680 [Pediculus humanus corporis]|uniref:Receptor ligand binding region domain-containing protein n=1 Tax=Pediculus humanus subsp. corporis TaxID=121224 RepID=E0VPJ2_PEDHC|nr:uncharacterized protein Phum_PHUM360680 [Pediculus humanus corporis]EEB15298.1 hypothetical protein Phum_PHUM360680 [Pediculus humanus corporis]